MNSRFLIVATILALASLDLHAQDYHVATRSLSYHLADRYRVLHGMDVPMVTTTNNYMRQDLTQVGQMVYRAADGRTATFNAEYLVRDNVDHYRPPATIGTDTSLFTSGPGTTDAYYTPEVQEPLLRYFYREQAAFLTYESDFLHFRANPILDVSGGLSNNEDGAVFNNTRGVAIRGAVDNKVYFYTSILETQRGFLDYQDATIRQQNAIPGNGLYKSYQSSVVDQLSGYDYLNATAYFGLPVSKHVALELGHGSHHIGHGYRSLLLSDFANNYFYLKLNSRVGKFQLQNLFGELAIASNAAVPGDELIPKKYFANHTLTYRPGSRLALSLFETVVFSRENQYELQYLNPIILYRTVEQFIGSPDNVMLGMDIRYDLWNRVSVYGQFLLDEFNINQLRNTDGWWGNKFGLQLGLKYFDVAGVSHLDLQLETNVVRPWTYSHGRTSDEVPAYSLSSYTHYGQPLAHPLGANFTEFLSIIRYQPLPRLHIQLRANYAQYGGDTSAEPFGGDIFRPNTDRLRQDGYNIGDGDLQSITGGELMISYMPVHNYFVDLTILQRSSTRDNVQTNTSYVGLGVRVNTATMPFDY